MSNENIKDEARIGLSLLNAELDRFQARADNAYIKYIGLCKQDGCLGWEIKVEKGWFGAGELQAHKAAAEELGRHRALQEMVNELRKLAGSNFQGQGREPQRGEASPAPQSSASDDNNERT